MMMMMLLLLMMMIMILEGGGTVVMKEAYESSCENPQHGRKSECVRERGGCLRALTTCI